MIHTCDIVRYRCEVFDMNIQKGQCLRERPVEASVACGLAGKQQASSNSIQEGATPLKRDRMPMCVRVGTVYGRVAMPVSYFAER